MTTPVEAMNFVCPIIPPDVPPTISTWSKTSWIRENSTRSRQESCFFHHEFGNMVVYKCILQETGLHTDHGTFIPLLSHFLPPHKHIYFHERASFFNVCSHVLFVHLQLLRLSQPLCVCVCVCVYVCVCVCVTS